MLSLETSKKLKDAGLKWKPKYLDQWTYQNGQAGKPLTGDYEDRMVIEYTNHFIWLPRLDQILAEIEARGYQWRLDHLDGRYCMQISNINIKGTNVRAFYDISPKESAAAALLWILEQEQ